MVASAHASQQAPHGPREPIIRLAVLAGLNQLTLLLTAASLTAV